MENIDPKTVSCEELSVIALKAIMTLNTVGRIARDREKEWAVLAELVSKNNPKNE